MGNDIAVVIEHLEGKVADISFEMLGKGRGVATAPGGGGVRPRARPPGLSGSLGWSLCAYCLDARLADGRLTAVSQIYGGKLLAAADVEGPSPPFSILAGPFPAEAGKAGGR